MKSRPCVMMVLMIAVMWCTSAMAAEPLAVIDEILKRPVFDSWAMGDLRRAMEGLPAADKINALDRFSRAGIAGTAPVAASLLADSESAVVVAAIATLTALWPTEIEHAVAVRQRIAGSDAAVTAAAIGFALRVSDDQAIPMLAQRLQRVSDDTGARNALRRLTKQDLADGGAWLSWYEQRQAAIAPLMAELARDVVSTDTAVAARAVHRLIGLKEQQNDVAQLLVVAAARPEAAVSDVAKAGLQIIGGPVAACWRPGQAPLPAEEPIPQAKSAAIVIASTPLAVSHAADWILLGLILVVSVGFVLAWRRCKPVAVEAAKQLSTRFVRKAKQMKWMR